MIGSTLMETERISRERAKIFLAQDIMTSIRWATFEFAIKGLSPLMMDRMTDAQIEGLVTKQKVDFPTDESLRTRALRKLYCSVYKDDMPDLENGEIGIPDVNLYAALRDAGMNVQWGSGKYDKVTLSTKGTELYSMIRLHESFYPILDLKGNPPTWVEDLRKGNATQGVGAVGIIRGKFNEWGIVGHVSLNIDGGLSVDKMKELFTVAGIKQGLCSARPSKKMPFGQFALCHLKHIGGADPKNATTRVSETPEEKAPAKRKTKAKKNGDGYQVETESSNGNGEVQS